MRPGAPLGSENSKRARGGGCTSLGWVLQTQRRSEASPQAQAPTNFSALLLPVARVALPLTPAVPALAVLSSRPPLVVPVLWPVFTVTLPPTPELAAPPTTCTLPPTNFAALCDVGRAEVGWRPGHAAPTNVGRVHDGRLGRPSQGLGQL